ncbi:MAG: uL30 family ribosomal protein [Nitrososphaerota archaeon]|jgi:large subunit ribosomal protein L30|nr:uL30 family ribosomal protein [Nitrososphaerota archaeon]MDG6926897.1 uL30 family ribosomal protein [Nitrososphaerota archaeon]MDG6929985.1 uL30 family ribosomal protein [Nitrososphaerota archaeon]MDG6931936.1 uL30 family ribosomal protein [Nitrososphaerota archaeon]MDG6943861.1 uL30 family ribosomal protein [Nitrososphaerota archaeon]
MAMLLVIRVKGEINVRDKVEETLTLMNLKRKYNATILNDNDAVRGMLQKAKDCIVWSKIDVPTTARLIEARGKVSGWKKLSIDYLKNHNLSGFDELAERMEKGEIGLKDIGAKPYFALPPPRGGVPRKKYTALELFERMIKNGNTQ